MRSEIERIVEQAMMDANSCSVAGFADDVARRAARLGFVAGMREAAKMARGELQQEQISGDGTARCIAHRIDCAADAIERGE